MTLREFISKLETIAHVRPDAVDAEVVFWDEGEDEFVSVDEIDFRANEDYLDGDRVMVSGRPLIAVDKKAVD